MTAPTERDFDLIEVALESAAQACQSGATLRNERNLDPLAREYLVALEAVREWRKVASRPTFLVACGNREGHAPHQFTWALGQPSTCPGYSDQ